MSDKAPQLNEIGRSQNVSAQTPDNPRLAYSNSVIIGILASARYRKLRFKLNFPRLTLPREHSNATTKAYAKPRD